MCGFFSWNSEDSRARFLNKVPVAIGFMVSRGNRSYKPNPRLARVLDVLFILHAEHEMNCSTAAARHLASRYRIFESNKNFKGFHFIRASIKILMSNVCSGVDVYTALAGAVGALYGPLHGGANEVIEKLGHNACISKL